MKYKLNNIILDVRQLTLEVEGSGELISRDEKLIAAMKLLVERYPEIVPKDELIKAIWPKQVVTDWSLTRFISDLRKTLGEHHNIKTVHGRGYRYTYPVEPLAETAGSGQPIEKSEAKAPPGLQLSSNTSKSKKPLYYVAALSFFALVAVLLFFQKTDSVSTEISELIGSGDAKPVVALVSRVEQASRYETGLALNSLLNEMLQAHDEIHLVSPTLVFSSLQKFTSGNACADLACTEVIFIHYATSDNQHELSFEHIKGSERYFSPAVLDSNSAVALEKLYANLKQRLPPTNVVVSPSMFTENLQAMEAYGEALAATAMKDTSRAREILKSVLQMQPDFILARILLANVFLYRGNIQEAQEIIDSNAFTTASEYEQLWINVVRYRLEWVRGNLQMALMILHKAELSATRISNEIYRKVLLDKGQLLYELGEPERAQALFMQANGSAKAARDLILYVQSLYCLAEVSEDNNEVGKFIEKANRIFDVGGLPGSRTCSQSLPLIIP